MTKTAYIDRVKKGIELYTAMEALKDSEELTIEYTGGRRSVRPGNSEFKIRCFEYIRSDETVSRSYTINDGVAFGKSMNIDMEKSGKSYLHCYTYDLFEKEATHKLYFEHITIKDGTEQDS